MMEASCEFVEDDWVVDRVTCCGVLVVDRGVTNYGILLPGVTSYEVHRWCNIRGGRTFS